MCFPANADKVLYSQFKRFSDTAKHMCPTSSVCNSFVQGVRRWKAKETVSDVERRGTHFGTIL